MKDTRHMTHDTGWKRIAYIFGVFFIIISLVGCDAFVRKFTRKSKKEDIPGEQMVLAPEEYKGSGLSNQDLYRQYFVYWQSWQEELLESLLRKDNHKKQVSCVGQAISSLEQLRALLNDAKKKQLDVYMKQMVELRNSIDEDTYSMSMSSNRLTADRLKRAIMRDFSYKKVKADLL